MNDLWEIFYEYQHKGIEIAYEGEYRKVFEMYPHGAKMLVTLDDIRGETLRFNPETKLRWRAR